MRYSVGEGRRQIRGGGGDEEVWAGYLQRPDAAEDSSELCYIEAQLQLPPVLLL